MMTRQIRRDLVHRFQHLQAGAPMQLIVSDHDIERRNAEGCLELHGVDDLGDIEITEFAGEGAPGEQPVLRIVVDQQYPRRHGIF
jgi:hypothetical protein